MSMSKPPLLLLLHYVGPSCIGMLIGGTFTLIDGFFIGQKTGDNGLAAINIVYPAAAFMNAIGLGIGAGFGTLYSLCQGRGHLLLAKRLLDAALWLLIAASGLLAALGIWQMELILTFLKCPPELEPLAAPYLKLVTLFALSQILFMGLLPLLRNSKAPKQAMAAMISGLVINIFLDWLFIMRFNWGVTGAAIATILGQSCAALICLSHLAAMASKERPRLTLWPQLPAKVFARAGSIGIAPFGVGLGGALIAMLHNWQALAYGGTTGTAAWTVINYAISPLILLSQGIGEGIQPLASFFRGSKDTKKERFVLKAGLWFGLFIGLLSGAILILSRNAIPLFFGASSQSGQLIQRGIVLSVLAGPFMALIKILASYLYAIGSSAKASLLIYGDSFILLPFFLAVLPRFWQLDGVWLAMAAAYLTLCAGSLAFYAAAKAKKLQVGTAYAKGNP